ncbi:hypothetical protein PoB_002942000 [Plakobranchus ocellatus]|uniref:Uncharacterized protein n=1 Tax=Plakobranchus ocellatus TaxID=259542 RepID=A0AAV4A6B6_9GAST|nr:hypothetical protein PoB_002942000 [Plakobranchus ocellatus]
MVSDYGMATQIDGDHWTWTWVNLLTVTTVWGLSLELSRSGSSDVETSAVGSEGASVVQRTANPPWDLQGPFCRGFELRDLRFSLTEGLKA